MIRLTTNPETAYVYHMLSVARCGYDNDYGARWRGLHDKTDLSVLHALERELTICGGEHEGRLYRSLISLPAQAVMPAESAYRLLERLFATQNPQVLPGMGEAVLAATSGLWQEAAAVCRVLERNASLFKAQVWPQVKPAIEAHLHAVQPLFDQRRLASRAQALLNARDLDFEAVLCASMAFGAEAIFISETQDVFGIDRSAEDAYFFLGHEYIIRLMMESLKDTSAFQDFSTWTITEGMAEYYLSELEGTVRFFNDLQTVAEECRRIRRDETLHPSALYTRLCALHGLKA